MKLKLRKDLQTGEKKEKIRQLFKLKRNNMSTLLREIKSNFILKRLNGLAVYKKAKIIMFYVNAGSEVETTNMIIEAWGKNKRVAVPYLDAKNDQIIAVEIFSLTKDLIKGTYGIMEPKFVKGRIISRNEIDLILVPAIVFDCAGNRLGYGKGYYDKWLKGYPFNQKVGLAYELQISRRLPISKHDVPVGKIITEKRTIYSKSEAKKS